MKYKTLIVSVLLSIVFSIGLKVDRKTEKGSKKSLTKSKDTRQFVATKCTSLETCETAFKNLCVSQGQNLILQEVTNNPFGGNNVVMPAAAAFVPSSGIKQIQLYTGVVGQSNSNADREAHPDRTLPKLLLNTYGANKGLDGGTILLFTSNKPCLTANPNLGCSKWVPDFAKEHNVKFKVYYFNPVSFDRAYLKENYLGLKKNLFVSGTGYDAKVVLKLIRAFANDYYTNELTNHGTNPLSDVNSKVMNISLEDLNATAFVSDADPVPNRILDIITQLTTAGFTNKPNWTRMVQANGVTTNDLDTLISRYAYFYNNMFGTKLVTFEWFH